MAGSTRSRDSRSYRIDNPGPIYGPPRIRVTRDARTHERIAGVTFRGHGEVLLRPGDSLPIGEFVLRFDGERVATRASWADAEGNPLSIEQPPVWDLSGGTNTGLAERVAEAARQAEREKIPLRAELVGLLQARLAWLDSHSLADLV